MQPIAPSNSRHILTPTKLNRLARTLLQSEIGMVWLSAEISNFVAAGSGHWYFTLKDSKAQIRAAMFRQANHKVVKRPKEGDKVLLRASVSLYEPRGDYQLIVEHMEAEGEGALKRELERLKLQLSSEGLFAAERKRHLPERISKIGVITSSSGAALHDVLTVLNRRAPDIEVIVYPTIVQGEQAPTEIIKALATANRRNEVDALLVTRGGGSLEDLWAFNNADLARAIAASALTVVSAVGHEIDITISDLVADLRAPTPSAAAELLSPDKQARKQRSTVLVNRLLSSFTHRLAQHKTRQKALTSALRLLHPSRQFAQHMQRIDNLTLRLSGAMTRTLEKRQQLVENKLQGLLQHHPQAQLSAAQTRLDSTNHGLVQAWQFVLHSQKQRFHHAAGQLHGLSPLATLARGYTISLQDGNAVTSAKEVDKSKPLTTRFHDGDIHSMPSD